MQQPAPTKEQIRRINAEFAAAGVVALAIIGIGVVFYRIVEKLSLVDAIYFCVITLTTVGYGDITPQTEIGKLFTSGYVLVGIGIIGTFGSLLYKRVKLNQQFRHSNQRN